MRYPIRVLSLVLLTLAFIAVAVIEPAFAQRRGGGAGRRGGGMSRGGARPSVSRPSGGGGFRPSGGGGGFAPRPPSFGGGVGPRPFDPSAPSPARSRNFGPDAKPQRGGNAKSKKKDAERPRGPIPLKATGRSFTLDDDSVDNDELKDVDDFATSKPQEDEKDEES